MTEQELSDKIDEMLRYYRKRLKDGNATPILCLGVGVGHRQGQAVVCLPHDIPLDIAHTLLKQTVTMIEEAMKK